MNRRFRVLKKAGGRRYIFQARNMGSKAKRAFVREIRYNRHEQLLRDVFFLKDMLPALCW